MWHVFGLVLTFPITFRTVALVVIDEVLTASRFASALWAIGDVSADPFAINDLLFETTVTFTVVVVDVGSSWVFVVYTFTVPALVCLTVIHVETSVMVALLSIRHTVRLESKFASQHAVQGIARLAFKIGNLWKFDLWSGSLVRAVRRYHHRTALNSFASRLTFILSVSLAGELKVLVTTRLSVHTVAGQARVRLLL
jgi:hypothetical protein